MTTTPTIWFLHGAGATVRSFNWLSSRLGLPFDCLDYEPSETVATVIERITKAAAAHGGPLIIVGHSLGGLITTGLVHIPNVIAIVTMAAPLGGLRIAGVMSLFSNERLFRDLTPYSSTITGIHTRYKNHPKPHLAIVTTFGGLPVGMEQNDGVVTVASQTAFDGPIYHVLALNHFEVLLADETADAINGFMAALDKHPARQPA